MLDLLAKITIGILIVVGLLFAASLTIPIAVLVGLFLAYRELSLSWRLHRLSLEHRVEMEERLHPARALTVMERTRILPSQVTGFVDGENLSYSGGVLRGATLHRAMFVRCAPDEFGSGDYYGWFDGSGTLVVQSRSTRHRVGDLGPASLDEQFIVAVEASSKKHIVFREPVRMIERQLYGDRLLPAEVTLTVAPLHGAERPPNEATLTQATVTGIGLPSMDPVWGIEARALFQQLLDAPDDDERRMVLADYFLERGQQLGRYLQLTAKKEPTLSEKALAGILLRDHRHAWLPPGVDAASAEFRRGLLIQAHVIGETNPTHVMWLSVESLSCGYAAPARQSPVDEYLPSLRVLSDVPIELLRRFAQPERSQLTRLDLVGVATLTADDIALLSRFPQLAKLNLRGTPGDCVSHERLVPLVSSLPKLTTLTAPIALTDTVLAQKTLVGSRLHFLAALPNNITISFRRNLAQLLPPAERDDATLAAVAFLEANLTGLSLTNDADVAPQPSAVNDDAE